MLHILRGPHVPEVFEKAAERVKELKPSVVFLEVPDDKGVRETLAQVILGDIQPALALFGENAEKYRPLLLAARHVSAEIVPIDDPQAHEETHDKSMLLEHFLQTELPAEKKAGILLELVRARVRLQTKREKHMQKIVQERFEQVKRLQPKAIGVVLVGTDHVLEFPNIPYKHEILMPRAGGGHPIVQAEDLLRAGKNKSEVLEFLRKKVAAGELGPVKLDPHRN